ncbi:ribosome maturation factor RimM [Gloeothece verrucosa]|uniref:Ribosome maturation factor RimM n=1 Tax=Gloeothece verrucosa (strain PCC 7822) TaxID=497965 RepID=E0U5C1_GLOV7|nr:ribosome maturation factor RimM [Gloeothece verrucosa]ADN13511.1 16S rRNA processing protein RimM [Gloeothece verrucosa PCC 7822]
MDDWLEIGTIVAPQGLKGEVRVSSESDFPERFEEPGKRWLVPPNSVQVQEVELLSGRYIPGKNIYVVQLAGIEDREEAEALRGYKLLVPLSDRPSLSEDEYHVADLINLEVYNQQTGENVGIVTELLWAGNDLLEVTLHQQPEIKPTPELDLSKVRKSKHRKLKPKVKKPLTVLIPFVKEIVPVVDLQSRRIEINPPAGLLEVNSEQAVN